MNKEQVMSALLCAESNISNDVIGFIGANLPDADMEVIPFNHEQDHVFEACGIEESDCAEMTETLNNYMNSLPKAQRQQSKAVEYILNSGNAKFLRIAVIAGLQKVRENAIEASGSSELSDLLLKALMRKLKDKDRDEE